MDKRKQRRGLALGGLLALAGLTLSTLILPETSPLDLKAAYASSHTLTMDNGSSFAPTANGTKRLTDPSFNLHEGGYIAFKSSATATVNYKTIGIVTSQATTLTGTMSITLDLYANGITSISFQVSSYGNLKESSTIITTYANRYSELEGAALSTITGTDATSLSGVNHLRFAYAATGSSEGAPSPGYPYLVVTSLTMAFTC